jgi:restriction endonuclease S subunit
VSWLTIKLGDLLKIQNGYAFDSKQFSSEGEMPLIRIRDIKKGVDTETCYTGDYDVKYVVKKGDLLIGMDGEFGCYEWKGNDALLNQRVCRLQEFENQIYPRFLLYGINSYLKAIEEITGYTTVKHISSKQIANIEFPLPPLSTQKKIVAKLDAIFTEIDKATAAAEANAKNAEAFFQSFLSRSLINNPECVSYKLSEICDIARGGSPRPIDKFITEDLDGINWVKIGDATRSKKYIYETKERIIREGISRSRLVNDGDFILSNSMSFGRPYIMRTSGCIHDGWLVLSNYKKHLDIDFFFYLLSSTIVKNQFERLAQGSTVRNLNKELVGKVEVSIPPLEIQKHMVKMLDLVSNSFDKAREAYGRKIIELELLRVSILKTGFAGELFKE